MKIKKFLTLVIFFFNIDLSSLLESFDDDIINDLLKTYNKDVRPESTVNVDFQLSYRQLVSLDEKSQILTSNLYLYANWVDGRLKWDPTKFSNLDEIVISATKLWLPDFAVINAAGTEVFITINDSNLAIVTSEGDVFLTISVSGLKTRCKVNVRKFPFDSQNCQIMIGSWQLDTTRIDFSSDDSKIALDDYVQSAVWILNNVTVKTTNTTSRYRTKDLVNEDVVFNIFIKRRPLYYIATFIPCFVLNVATLLAFFVSNAIVVQVNLCMTTFLTFGVFSLKISGDITTQSEYFPLANIYFIIAIFYTLISLIWFVTANYYLTRNRLPRWMAFIAKFVKIVLFCIFPRVKSSPPINKANKPEEKLDSISESPSNNGPQIYETGFLRNRTIIAYENKPPAQKPACNKCEMCKNCETSKDKENEKKKAKELLDSNIFALNWLVFIFVFLLMLGINLWIWIEASS